MKKYLYSALALPLLFACSSENFDEKVISNDQFAGIEKVDAEFSMEGTTRFDGGVWNTEEGDVWGFAWMGDGTNVAINGNAYQNHNLIQTDGIFKPQTSIYVGKYYIYRPYDKTTVSPQAINFESLVNQPLAEGYESDKQPWQDLAKTAINIGDVWTDVSVNGTTFGTDPTIWNKAGIKDAKPEKYKIYAAMFSNQTGLDLTYVKNNPKFGADKQVTGATDIDLTYTKGTEVGAADIYEATVELAGAAKSFTYAPNASPNGAEANHSGTYWADKSNLGGGNGFTFTAGAITLTPADKVNGISTGADGSKAWFWFNSLPVTNGLGNENTVVTPIFTTSYGIVTVLKEYPATNYTVKDCAYALNKEGGVAVFHPLADAADATKTPTVWAIGANNTFINQYGNHKGKFALTVDFSKGVMNKMHIQSDAHLQKLLKYYIASGKNEVATLLLDKDGDNEFKLSKLSIALLQTINKSGIKVLVKACDEDKNGNPSTAHTPGKIVVTQVGSDGKTEVPELDKVFAAATDVYLAGSVAGGEKTKWTWKERSGANQLKVDANVASLTNLGNLEVNASNIQLTTAAPIKNAAGATMKITKVTTVKNALTNLGTINVGDENNKAAELRAYDAEIKNYATGLADGEYGVIINYGVVGKSAGTSGAVNNYGYIKMLDNNAITLLNSNEMGTNPFASAFVAGTNMMGVVELPSGNPYALVSVSNADETGFIKYEWNNDTYAHDPGNVKYNTIIVKGNKIAFSGNCTEIKYIEFNGTRTQVINPVNKDNAADKGRLPNLKGIAVYAGKSIIIEKTNGLRCAVGSYLQPKTATAPAATVYRGGVFDYTDNTNYFGNWNLDQIVEY